MGLQPSPTMENLQKMTIIGQEVAFKLDKILVSNRFVSDCPINPSPPTPMQETMCDLASEVFLSG